ncbi:MAG TPA: 6-bladed beta-propeller [Longimicrobiaceae bacterium]|nr:6-bladed beta-propeller [Longimicrobiaceae bacterium]
MSFTLIAPFFRWMQVLLILGFLPSALDAQSPRESWTLVEELRIGSFDRPNYTLTRVSDLAIGEDGSIYVGQDMDKLVRVFDSDGEFVRTIGAEGGGPGEFRSVRELGWRADSLWVVDFSQFRVNLFNAAGENLHTFGFNGAMVQESSRPTAPRRMLSDGTIVATPLIGNPGPVESLPILRMDRAGVILDTLGTVSIKSATLLIRTDQLTLYTRYPVESYSLWDISPADTSVVIVHRPLPTDPEEGFFRLQKYGSANDTIFDRRFRYTPKPVPGGYFDVVEMHSEFLGMLPVGIDRPEMEQALRDSIPIPDFQAPITELKVGRDGTIWLRRDGLGSETVQWIVFDVDGDIIAELSAPAKLEILAAQRDMVWGVIEDELEVPYVVRYRVGREPTS